MATECSGSIAVFLYSNTVPAHCTPGLVCTVFGTEYVFAECKIMSFEGIQYMQVYMHTINDIAYTEWHLSMYSKVVLRPVWW